MFQVCKILLSVHWNAMFLLLLFAGCGQNAAPVHTHEPTPNHTFAGSYPIKVLCTTGPVAELVARVGGQHVRVQALMGPGVDPHLYRPIASDVRALNDADVVCYNGLHLEGRMVELFEQMARLKLTFAVTAGLVKRHDQRLLHPAAFAGSADPHVWHDVALWADCAGDVAARLSLFDPRHAEDYRQQAATYQQELRDLDNDCREQLAKIPASRRVLVTAHDAFGYFGKAYGLEVFGLKGISTEDEIDLAHQQQVIDMLIERRVPAVFVESAIAPRTVQALVEPCAAAGLALHIPEAELFADALGSQGSDVSTYEGMIRHNVALIVNALGKGQ